MKPKIRRKDYESKSEYLNALVVRYWWQILLVYSLATALIILLSSLLLKTAYIAFLIIYSIFLVIFISEVVSEKKQTGGCPSASPLSILLFSFSAMVIIFIAILFKI